MGGREFRHPLSDIPGHGKLAGADRPVNIEADDFPIVESGPLPRLRPGPLDGPKVRELDATSVTEGDAHILQARHIQRHSRWCGSPVPPPQRHTAAGLIDVLAFYQVGNFEGCQAKRHQPVGIELDRNLGIDATGSRNSGYARHCKRRLGDVVVDEPAQIVGSHRRRVDDEREDRLSCRIDTPESWDRGPLAAISNEWT